MVSGANRAAAGGGRRVTARRAGSARIVRGGARLVERRPQDGRLLADMTTAAQEKESAVADSFLYG